MGLTPYTRDRSFWAGYQVRNSAKNWPANPNIQTNKLVVRKLDGYRDPDWRKKIADQTNATTGMVAYFDSVDVKRSHCTFVRVGGCNGDPTRYESTSSGDHAPYMDNGSWLNALGGYTNALSSVDSRANAAAFKAIRDAQVYLQGQVVLGEARETFRMLRHPAKALFDRNDGFLRKVNKARRRDAKGWLKTAGELWLENAFGWQPLLNDVKDAARALKTLVNGTHKRSFKFSAGATGSILNNESWLINHSPSTALYLNSYKQDTESRTVRFRGAVATQVHGKTWEDARLFGFDPASFVPSAWELLPWSFMIDYFTNVGDILESTYTSTTDLAWCNRTIVQRKQRYRTINWAKEAMLGQFGCPETYVDKAEDGWYKHVVSKVTRDVGVFPTVPSLYIELPGKDRQLFNCAALFSLALETHPQRTFNPKTGRQYIF
jgi:hypothetical protein